MLARCDRDVFSGPHANKQADCSVPGFFSSFEAAEHGGTAAGPKLSPMLSESSPWKGIFTRRSSADKAKPPKRGDRNASLRELALQQVLELDATAEVPTLTAIPILTRCWSRARSDAAAEAPLDDLREIASVIALWPPACLPWVLPPRSSPALCVLLRQRPAQSRLRRAPRSGHPGATSSAYELREHGGECTLSLLRYAPDVGRAAKATAGEASPAGGGGALEAPAPMYDYRGV